MRLRSNLIQSSGHGGVRILTLALVFSLFSLFLPRISEAVAPDRPRVVRKLRRNIRTAVPYALVAASSIFITALLLNRPHSPEADRQGQKADGQGQVDRQGQEKGSTRAATKPAKPVVFGDLLREARQAELDLMKHNPSFFPGDASPLTPRVEEYEQRYGDHFFSIQKQLQGIPVSPTTQDPDRY